MDRNVLFEWECLVWEGTFRDCIKPESYYTVWGDIEIIKRDHKENRYISDLCTVKYLLMTTQAVITAW